MEPEGDRAFRLLFVRMDPVVISALIAAASAMIINIVTNVILSSRQTALLEYRIKQLEDMLIDIRQLPGRIITSGRRYEKRFPLITMWQMFYLRCLYRRGVDIQEIAEEVKRKLIRETNQRRLAWQ